MRSSNELPSINAITNPMTDIFRGGVIIDGVVAAGVGVIDDGGVVAVAGCCCC